MIYKLNVHSKDVSLDLPSNIRWYKTEKYSYYNPVLSVVDVHDYYNNIGNEMIESIGSIYRVRSKILIDIKGLNEESWNLLPSIDSYDIEDDLGITKSLIIACGRNQGINIFNPIKVSRISGSYLLCTSYRLSKVEEVDKVPDLCFREYGFRYDFSYRNSSEFFSVLFCKNSVIETDHSIINYIWDLAMDSIANITNENKVNEFYEFMMEVYGK